MKMDSKYREKLTKVYLLRSSFLDTNVYNEGTAGFWTANVRYMAADEVIVDYEVIKVVKRYTARWVPKPIYGPGNWQSKSEKADFPIGESGQRVAKEWVEAHRATIEQDTEYRKWVGSSIYESGLSTKQNLRIAAFDINWMDVALDILVKCLDDVYTFFPSAPGAEILWEELYLSIRNHLEPMRGVGEAGDLNEESSVKYLEMFNAQSDMCRLAAGINPRRI